MAYRAAVLTSSDRHDALTARLEDTEDSLSIADATGEETEPATTPFDRIGMRT